MIFKPMKVEVKEKLPVLVGIIVDRLEEEIKKRDEEIRVLKNEICRLSQKGE